MAPALDPKALRVLVVDDDADMRLYLRGCLRALGAADVREAADGDEGLRLARLFTPDLVISDLVMPGLDGLALCRALRAEPAPGLFLLISGEPAAPHDGADGFLAKPFNAAGLRAEVERLLAPPS